MNKFKRYTQKKNNKKIKEILFLFCISCVNNSRLSEVNFSLYDGSKENLKKKTSRVYNWDSICKRKKKIKKK